jgi:hypothetical protein
MRSASETRSWYVRALCCAMFLSGVLRLVADVPWFAGKYTCGFYLYADLLPGSHEQCHSVVGCRFRTIALGMRRHCRRLSRA